MSASPSPFRLLLREFFAQFLTSESSISDRQLHQAIVGVLAFVITPGLLIPFQMDWAFEFAAIQFPAMLDPLTRLLATIFLTYSIVVIGVVAAFEWDALSFDRRDAMVLGPLPVAGRTVVSAKLAALGALLLAAAAAINILTALPFSLVAGAHGPMSAAARLFVAHLAATMAASTFVFSALVAVRATLGMVGRGRIAVGTLLQFALVSALLSFFVFVPTSLHVDFVRVHHGPARPLGIHVQPIPGWSPTNWFVGLYDVVRGTATAGDRHAASIAVMATAASVLAAVATMLAGYRHQMRLALAPSASSGTVGGARLPRALARLLAGRRAAARGAADFIVATLARSRAQQAPIAMNAAIAAVMVVLDLSRSHGDVASHLHAGSASPTPFLLVYWVAIGLRASFFVPSELPAAWIFRTTPVEPAVSHAALRGAMLSVLLPIAAVLAVALAPFGGWTAALRHLAFAGLATVLLVEAVAATVPFLPFTRPYQPGHAKLKTRWPLYLLAAYAFGYAMPRIERAYWFDPTAFAAMLVVMGALVVAIDRVSRSRARRALPPVAEDVVDDEDRIAVLNIGGTIRQVEARG